jgi:hypothetical protein
VFAKLDRDVGVERFHETVAEDVAGDDVGMSRDKISARRWRARAPSRNGMKQLSLPNVLR